MKLNIRGGLNVHVTKEGKMKETAKGKPLAPRLFMRLRDKGEQRRIRRALRAAGQTEILRQTMLRCSGGVL